MKIDIIKKEDGEIVFCIDKEEYKFEYEALDKLIERVYNNDADAEKLYVKAIFVDEGPILKRFAARAKGSGTRILKRTCHITCVVDER